MQNDATFIVLVCIIAFFSSKFIDKYKHVTRKAPLVQYTLPWLGSAVELGKNPDNVFQKAIAKFGPVFRMYAAGREFTYITAPELISAVYRDPKNFKFLPIKLEIMEKIMGGSRSLIKDPVYFEDFYKLHHNFLSPEKASRILRRYAPLAHESLKNTLDEFDIASETVVDLSFIKSPAYDAAAYAIFGKRFPASESFEHFITFFEGFLLLQTNLPYLLKKKYASAREKLLTILENYLSNSHEDCSELRLACEDLSNRAKWSPRDIAANALGDLWALESNAIQAAYWIIALQLQRPEGLKHLTEEIDAARSDWLKQNDDSGCAYSEDERHCQWIFESPLPLLTSVIHESLRYTTFSLSIRQAENETIIGGYKITKGDYVVCATRSIHMDGDIHENPTEFVPNRYDKPTKFIKNNRVIPNHSMPFGGGVSMCEGRHFALGELKIFIALLLSMANIELYPLSAERPRFNWPLLGTGVVPPIGNLSVCVTRRRN